MNKYKPFFEAFFAALEKNKISYVILRGFEQLPDFYSNDVDFGVIQNDLFPFLRILKEQGELFDGKLSLFKVRLGVYKLRLKLPSQDIDVDIWTSFNYGGLFYLNHEELVNNPIYHNSFKVPKPENEVALSYLKEFLHLNRLRKDKVGIIKGKINDKFKEPFQEYFNPQLAELFEETIQNEEFNLKPYAFKAKKVLILNNIKQNGILTTIKSILKFIWVRLNGKNIIKNTFKKI